MDDGWVGGRMEGWRDGRMSANDTENAEAEVLSFWQGAGVGGGGEWKMHSGRPPCLSGVAQMSRWGDTREARGAGLTGKIFPREAASLNRPTCR